jgi:zinc protease
MIDFVRFTLENGLRVIVHEDNSTPLIAMNLLYDVGSKDEQPEMTGIAHLFEHLMFSGTETIPDFDRPLQMAGGENNAFTNNDITNYFLTIPAQNIETGFWLESDRMTNLDFSERNLTTQKHVVIEEFNQRYLNQPYGDSMLKLRPLAYTVHPYRWPAIGIGTSHIEKVGLKDIKEFFYTHYAPNNAILTLTGKITPDSALQLCNKWFGPIPSRKIAVRNLIPEPRQTEARTLDIVADVPSDAIYKVWHVGPRMSQEFPALDLLTDILAGGESGRLHTKLVRELKIFSEINAYLTADADPGLIILHGKLMKNADIYSANEAIEDVLGNLLNSSDSEEEMEKVKNRFEATTLFSHTNILNKAISLAHFEFLGDAEMINGETEIYRNINREMVNNAAETYLRPDNCSTLFYKSSRTSS